MPTKKTSSQASANSKKVAAKKPTPTKVTLKKAVAKKPATTASKKAVKVVATKKPTSKKVVTTKNATKTVAKKPVKVAKTAKAKATKVTKVTKPAAKKAAIKPTLEQRLEKQAFELIDQAASILKQGIKTSHKATAGARRTVHRRAHKMLSKASSNLDNLIETSLAAVRKTVDKF